MKTHSFVAALVLTLPIFAQSPATLDAAGQGQGQRNNTRFRGMDTNGDGRITRAEWQGNDNSFRNHDWNNDGVLSGDEIRVGAVRRRNPGEDEDQDGFYDWTPQAFRVIDSNRDNRISRNEWQYAPELFLRADRNRDNLLTRSEFLGNEDTDRDSEDRFADLDTNSNGRIERAEWHGTRDAFDWLDRNNDGRLSRDETVGNDEPVGTSGRRVGVPRMVMVNAETRWTDTGINLRAGDIIRVQAEGRITMSGNDDSQDTAIPSGAQSGRRAVNSPLPQLPAGALIGRIDDGAAFFIGDGRTVERAPTTGRLYLGVNDDHLPDNRGQFRVTVSVER